MAFFGNQNQTGGPDPTAWRPDASSPRLSGTRGASRDGTFTSDLSVAEYALLQEAGFEPLGFVLGSSIYHIGIQVARWGRNQELSVLTQAMYSARELAMNRMQAEADLLGADGVVGVSLDMQTYVWGEDVLEFIASGTAIRAIEGGGHHKAPNGKAFSTDLSVQDFYRLLQTGAVPTSFVMGTCVFHIAHQGVLQSLRQVGVNQEMPQFTQGVYEARELALNRMQAEVRNSGGTGVLGVRLQVENYVWGEHATEFLALGTAVRPLTGGRHQSAMMSTPTFTLGLDA